MRVAAILGHPNGPSFNRALAHQYIAGLVDGGADVDVLDLEAMEFDPILHHGYDVVQPLEPDLVRAQQTIYDADHLVVAFPVWWGTPPALVEGFFERTFLPGWAFRFGRFWPLPYRLLKGRSAHLIVTMDSPKLVYHLWYRRSAHRAVANGTLRFCGFGPVTHTTIGAVKYLPEPLLDWHLESVHRVGERHARR
jgi:putative NADPH-quinone reductase